MESVLKGKKIVIGIIITILLLDIIVIAITSSLYAYYGEIDEVLNELVTGSIRLILESFLLFFLYKGHQWAKSLLVFLLLLGVIFSLFSLLLSFNIWMIFMAVLYIIISVNLLVPKSVKDFFRYQRSNLESVRNEKTLNESYKIEK